MIMPVKRKKKPVRKGNFIKRLQARPKVKSVRAKIKKKKAELKKLSGDYRRVLKSESRIAGFVVM